MSSEMCNSRVKIQTLKYSKLLKRIVQNVYHSNYYLVANKHLFYSDTSISNGVTKSLISYALKITKSHSSALDV
jgi:hypothetical protein